MNCSLFKINLLQEFAPKGGQFEVLKESDFLVHSRVISQEDIRKHEILNVYLKINYDSSVLNLKLIAPRCAVFNQFY